MIWQCGTHCQIICHPFQLFEATDENDLEVAIVVLREGTHIDNAEEERSACAGTYFGMSDAR